MTGASLLRYRSHMLRPVALLLALLLVPAAAAQSQGFMLGESGEWIQTEQAPVEGDAAVIAEARRLIADDRPGAAENRLDRWISDNKGGDSPYLVEAYLLRGDARAAQGNEYLALYDYERVIRGFPGSESFRIAVEREFEIGTRYLDGLRRKFFGLRLLDASAEGEELAIRVQERLPGSALAEQAAVALARHYYDRGDVQLAEESYEVYLLNYPTGQHVEEAMERLIYTTIAAFKGPRYDNRSLVNARERILRYMRAFPVQAERKGLDERLLARVEESMSAQMLETARWYLKRNDRPAAQTTLRRLVKKHPETKAATKALEILVDRGWLEEAPALEAAEPEVTTGEEAPPTAESDS